LTARIQYVTIWLQDIDKEVRKMSATTKTAPKKTTKILEYKGHPLRRKDNLIYYGSMSDKYIIMLQITEEKETDNLSIPTRVAVQLQYTDPDLKSRDRVLKKSDKASLYEAIDLAAVWLNRALAAG
jgi:arginyl-tRNA synthetase